jgi:carbon-monoxide dehydrogenase small subunit
MSERHVLRISVNGAVHEVLVPSHRTLLDLIRDDLGLTGTKRGCDDASCGACTVLCDGEARLSCISLALCHDGAEIRTVESLTSDARLKRLGEAFIACGGFQCGYCTPGILVAARKLLDACPEPSDDEIRRGISNNLCRCTGYGSIVESVRRAVRAEVECSAATAPRAGGRGS